MTIKIVMILMFIVYSLLQGFIDAHTYHYKNTSSSPKGLNLHPFLSTIRGIILVLMYLIFGQISFIIGLSFIFSYFHNGMYYLTRDDLSPGTYPKRWSDSSSTSTSFWEFDYVERIILMQAGVVLIALSFIIQA
jgi:hypothetical protein